MYTVLLTAGGADGDLDAHLEGRRRFAGRAGREKPFSLEHFTGTHIWNTKASPCFNKLQLLWNAAGMQKDICGDLRTGGWKLLKGTQQCTECKRKAISMDRDSHISCGLKYMKTSVRHKEMYKMTKLAFPLIF